ncbi:hypothetical protein GLA29479_2787 [Lysobacter antibioticus]|nr:hypothetical protein GLA29479_2787 [Lysobacter antibioticus]
MPESECAGSAAAAGVSANIPVGAARAATAERAELASLSSVIEAAYFREG